MDRRSAAAILVIALAVLGAFAPRARAQAVAIAEMDGYVTDPSGQAIVGAQVKATEVDKGQVRSTVSEENGRYALPDLPVGNYQLEVSAKGFKTYVQTGIVLQVASNVTVNVPMQLGAVTESIRVEANAAMVETKENAVAQVIDTERMIDLPLNGRNPTQLLTLTGAGTSSMTLNGGDLTGSKNIQGTAGGSGQFSVAGSQANGINFLLDGGDNNDAFSNVALPIPFPDAVAEFNVQVNGLPAQYGLHPGGVVNVVTKSGANAFHGDLFGFLRNGDLNARPKGISTVSSTGVFSNSLQPKRDSLKRPQFGGTAGGRIIKDKLFFFGGYQGTRQRSDPAQNTAYVPTPGVLQGNFSVVDGAKSAGGCLSTAKQLKDTSKNPYPGNLIPQSQFDPAGYKLESTYLPATTDPCGTVLFGYLADNPDDQWIGHIDYIFNDKHSLYGRYYIYDYLAESLFDGHNALTSGQSGNKDRTQNMTLGDTYTLSPTQVNSFHITANRRRDNRSDPANMFGPNSLGVNMWTAIPDYTQLTVSSYSGGGFNIGCGTCALATFDVNTYQLSDDFTFIRGRHQFAFGFDGRKSQFNSVNQQQSSGQFTFNGSTTGDGMADLLIGRLSGLTDGKVISDYIRLNAIAAYAQDAFHVTSRFTVNFGLRWEPSVPAYDKYGRGNQFNWDLFEQGWHSSVYPTAPAGLVFYGDPQDKYGKALTASHWGTVSPRLGIVWDPKGDGKQTLRAAFTLIHDTNELFYPERWTTNSPYVSSLSFTSGQFSNPFAGVAGGDPFPGTNVFPSIATTGAPGAYISVPPDISPMYVMQWNLSYQRQIKTDWRVTASYLGNATRHLLGSVDANYSIDVPFNGAAASTSNTNQRRLTYLANPTTGGSYGDIQTSDDGNNGEYHALLASILHRMATNFTFLGNYTWSHCVSDWDFAGELAGPVYQSSSYSSRIGERGNCGFDHRQVVNISLVYTSPGLGHHIAKAVTKNWQLGAISSLATGYPIQLTDGGKDISLSGQGLDRPENVLPGQVYDKGATGSYYNWFNPQAFECYGNPTGTACSIFTGQFGDLGRNSLYGPGQISLDTSLTRRFDVGERVKMDLRADFFNVMNHANPNTPTTSITSSTFGEITTFGTPRQIQMALKLYF
ncbi:MAG: carboxypeptidase regulatory-like domain-containing protein [Bryobacteraceae bacterium]